MAATPWWFGPWKIEILGLRLLSVGTPQKPLSVGLLLAAIALAMHPSIRAGWARRSPLAFYALAAAVMWLFCLGPAPTLVHQPLLYKAPYAWLMLLPGVDGIRVPARFWVLSTFCLAMAVALAYAQIVRRWPRLQPALPFVLGALFLAEAWPEPLRLFPAPAPRPAHARAAIRLELPLTATRDLRTLYRAIEHRRPVVNGYSGYFAPHYWALRYLLGERDRDVLPFLTTLGTIEAVVDHDEPGSQYWLGMLAAHPDAELVHRADEYTVYRLPRTTASYPFPELAGRPLPIAGIRASLFQDLVGRMTDGDRITRWHTGGPQDPSNEVIVDLGSVRQIQGIEMQIAGYVADFPRRLTIEVSDDQVSWRQAWSGSAGLIAVIAALREPLTMPLRFPLTEASGRYIRMRQTAEDPVFYWSIAELHVLGS